MIKKIVLTFLTALLLCPTAIASSIATEPTYLQAVITIDTAVEIKKSAIFDASKSFIPNPDRKITYSWDFGDGNKNEGVEVLHAYREPGYHEVTLTVDDGYSASEAKFNVFAYEKLIVLITDQTEDKDRIMVVQEFAEKKFVFIKAIESFGSSTEFISEEVLTKKLTEESNILQKASEIVVWTKENAGLNALSRFAKGNSQKTKTNFSQKTILVIENVVSTNISRIQRQFELINPKRIILAKEAAIDDLIESKSDSSFIETLQERGRDFELIDSKSGKLRPWNFMSYFVNVLVNNGIPDNTIVLLLLLPVIATVVAFMRQVIGVTTFGIYTPSIITLSFLIIGMYAGLLTLLTAILVGSLARPLLKRVRMLFIPKMAIVISLVSLTLLIVLISSINLGFFDATFLSIAIFPMLILSTLVEKFVTAKSEQSYSSAGVLMAETVLVAIVAYFIAGGEINLGFTALKFEFIKRMMLTYPEIVFLFLIADVLLGKWSGLRVLERIRFREVLRHIEEE